MIDAGAKEIEWWSAEALSTDEVYNLHRYIDLMDSASQKILENVRLNLTDDSVRHPVIFGDGTPNTLFMNSQWNNYMTNGTYKGNFLLTPMFLSQIQPDAKLLLILRNPITMIFSSYKYFNKQKISYSEDHFHMCVVFAVESFMKCQMTSSLEWCVFNYAPLKQPSGCRYVTRAIGLGHYHVYIQEWLRYFPREQLMILKLEHYSNQHRATVENIWKFLGLRKLPKQRTFRLNHVGKFNVGTSSIGNMYSKTKQILFRFYLPSIRKLMELIGPSFTWT